jgi:D-lactate dehydrogenase (cytochrome)
MGSGLKPGALEFMDTQLVRLLNEYREEANFPESPLLLIELHGDGGDLSAQMNAVRTICEEHNAIQWSEADEEEIETIWRVRRDAYPAACEYYPDRTVGVIGDVVVPISNYPEIVRRIEEISEALGLLTPCVGHAGDGNIHFLPVVDTSGENAMDRVHELNEKVVGAALELGGTATGEHGIGIGKRKFMREEHGDGVDIMRGIKNVIDPNGIMNPEKTLPD